jgi:uncharacterized protein YjbJ (UPF0337 family)
MNWTIIEGKWNQLRGRVKEEWGRLTDDDLDRIAGKRDQLLGKLQERYGYDEEHAEEELQRFADKMRLD